MKHTETLLVLVILIIAGSVRLYKIDNPVADWHSWRQADTAAVTRNFDKFGFNPFIPRYDDVSNIQTGFDNPEGYRFVEFPIYQSTVYAVSKLFSFFPISIEIWHRSVSIIASLGSIYLLYLIGKRFANKRVGYFSALFFALLPYSVYYSRVILPEVFLVFFMLLTLYLFTRITHTTVQDKPQKLQIATLLLSGIAGAAALLIKPYAVFFFLPIVYLWFQNRLFSKKHIVLGFVYALIILTPFILWRVWILRYPEGIPAWDWLFNSDAIRFKGAFFRWLFAERLSKLLLGSVGIWLLIIGILSHTRIKRKSFFNLLGIGALLYISILATGNVKHDYYQVIILPVIVFYLAIGVDSIISQAGVLFNKSLTYSVLAISIVFMMMFSWYEVRGYYWINNQAIVDAGMAADEMIPINAKVIAPYGGDTAFLYQTNRQGWPIGFDIEDKITKGASYYVSITPQDPEVIDLKSRYTTMLETDSYIILQLK